jgi:hypothetical protein
MDAAEAAFAARRRGEDKAADKFLRQAFEFESKAARRAATRENAEPTRSILLRSAASLALDCAELREAERLVALALSGEPPAEVSDELRDLLEEIHFRRHLDVRGVVLDPHWEVQFSMAGSGVGYGTAPSTEFTSRVDATRNLMIRAVERKFGLPFRERGRAQKDISRDYEVFVQAPRAASFAVTFRLGCAREQIPLFKEEASSIVNEVLTNLELFESGREDELRQRIPEEDYYVNFKGLANQLAPDGKEVTLVGFTSLAQDGTEKRVALRKTPASRRPPRVRGATRPKVHTIRGRLEFADERSGSRNSIRITTEAGEEHEVVVPRGMMADIVKPLWGSLVQLRTRREARALHLIEIKRLRD